jgi:hypothetical protein
LLSALPATGCTGEIMEKSPSSMVTTSGHFVLIRKELRDHQNGNVLIDTISQVKMR